MKKLLAKIRKILRDRRTRRFLTRFVSGIAAIVVFVTTYALVLPAITMEKEADCGIEAHQHDDSCYTRELICDIPESDGHQHGESCYSTTTSLMCGMDEHEHSLENGCYDDDGNLICEAEEHKHSDGCYEEVRELTCQTPESEGHHHTDACYEKVLSCGKEVHVHSAACYENDPVPDSAVAAGTSSAAAATTSAVSVSSVGMTLSFEGDNTGTGETDEPAAADRPADHGGSADDGGFVDNAGSVERDESGKSDGSEKSAGSGKTDSSVEAASSGEVNADDTVEMTYGSENAGTGSTETANAALTNTDNDQAAADQYVPTLEAVDFNTILNDRTGIYYYHVADGETVEDSSAIPAEDWKRIPNNKERMKNMDEPELGSNDLLRVYLSYTIPAGSLNATNPVARYRLPSNLHLTDSQVKAINENVNGMTGQYVDMSALEITDPVRYYAYLGVEAVEGNRRPDEAVEDYLAEQARKTGTDPDEAAEYISAVVRVENVYDVDCIYGDKDAYLGQDLIFTFAPYSIEKNQHEYDSKGQPTKAGREIEGWFTLDLNMGQVDLGEAEITTSTVVESEADYADGNAEDDRAEDGRTEADRAEDGRTEADRAEADRAEGGRTEADRAEADRTEDGRTEADRTEDDRTEDENAADGQTEDEHNANDNNAENSVEDKDNNPAGESEEDTENPQNNTVTTERAERTAEIVFVEDGRDGKNNKIEKISTRVRVVEETVIQTQDNDAEENSEESGAGNTEKSAAGSTEESAADNDADRSGKEKTDQTVMPAMSFTDSIRVSTGKPAGIDEDAEGTLGSAVRSLPQEAEVTVRVEADEGTFPAGTTMVLKAVEDLDAVAEAVTETVENSDPSVSADDADHQSEQTKESRNRNTEEKKNLKTYGFQAVDITFLDKDGKDIQPAKPVRVALTSEIAEQVKEEAKTSEVADPLVVHVDDDGNAEQMELLAPEEIKPAQGKTEQELPEEDRTSNGGQEENGTTDAAGETPSVGFTADSFSIYALVYTVDFEYSVNGQMYDFSLPGGGFVSFTDLVEVLGIIGDTNTEQNGDETGSVIAENNEENAANEGAEENSVNSDTNTSLTLGGVEVSEATRNFVADVTSVEFSNSELVDVSRVEADTTVGQIKDSRGLECEYSAELTEEQIAEINAQTVEAGDWALISVQPFTSEETLTVTMKNGDQFVVKVTDGQIRKYVISDSGDTYEVIVTYDDSAEIPVDAELRVREIKDTEEKYTRNIEASNIELQSQGEHELVHPVQFDIAIVSGGEEVEPKEGSIVNVEIRLAKSLLEEDVSTEKDSAAEEETGLFLFNGQEIALDSATLTGCRIAHIAEDGTAEIIEDVENSVTDDKIVMQFETESFSDYLFDTTSEHSFDKLPNTIYVGDEIYMWNHANYWVTNINSVVTETKANNSDNHKTVTAINTGTFRIYNRYNQNEYREIRVLPARTGTTPPATIDTIDNASIGLTLNLFDYDLNGSLDSYFNGSSHNDNPLSTFAGSGINSGNALKFWGSGIGNNYGSLNQYVEHGVTSIVSTNLNSAGYPVLSNSSGGSGNRDLSYLFTPSNGTDKKAYTNVNGLFKKDGDYYVYDSNQNYAWYNPSTNRFDVYNSTYNQKSGSENGSIQNKSIGFFPFHPWDNQYDLYVNWNKNLNHHFGMSMSVPFSLPKAPKAMLDTNGEPIIFEFSGDDDLWVFVDGKLAMDIGGIHQPTSGTINFTNQTVTVNGQPQSFNFSGLDDGKQHTLQVFYIERGGCDSNCKIKFNMTLYGDVHFDKVDDDDPTDKLAGAVFGLYKDEDCTIPVMERLKNAPDRAYIAESDANGRVQFSDIPIGTYYLKELHAPEGYPLDDTVHTVQVFYDQAAQQVKVKVTIDGVAVENGVKITNKKPVPITLGLQKEWQNEAGGTIAAPAGAEATFEIKRIRYYETYTEQAIEGQGREVSHLTVGWIHNGQMHVHGEYDLIVGTTATVSWGYNTGYTGSKDCIVNGTRIDKDYVTGNVISEALTMPAAGQTATIYIVDDSENGEAIRSINVAGSQFYGNSGGGVIHTFETFTEPDPNFTYTGTNVLNNRVTLPINSNTWSYNFTNLPTFERGNVAGVDHEVSFNYSYYLEEVSSNSPDGTTVVYKDSNGNVINSPTDAETSESGIQTIVNQVDLGALELKKIVTFNKADDTTTKTDGTYKFTISGIDSTFTMGISHTVEITFANGRATKYKIDSVETSVTGTDNTWSVLLNNLIPGEYVITETDSGPLTLEKIEGGKDDGDIATKKVTVTVSPGKNATADLLNTAKASFTNNKSETDVTLKKVDAVSKSPINGAKFSLKAGMEYADLTKLTITNLSDGTEAAIEDLTTLTGTIKVINVPVSGIKIAGLPNGDYTLKEEKAPDGYVITNGEIDFTATDGTIGNPDAEDGFTFVVENEPGAALPNTGGPGTRLFTILGSILILGAGVLLWRRRRLI